VFSLVGCKGSEKDIEERKNYWNEFISRTIPVGTSEVKLKAWANENGFKYLYDESKNMYYAIIEKIDGDSFVCSQWNIAVQIYLDEQRKTKSHKVESVGTCL